MIVKLKEVFRDSNSLNTLTKMVFKTRDILVNSEHISYLRENSHSRPIVLEGSMPAAASAFCTIALSSSGDGSNTEILVVGTLQEVSDALGLSSKKEILHG